MDRPAWRPRRPGPAPTPGTGRETGFAGWPRRRPCAGCSPGGERVARPQATRTRPRMGTIQGEEGEDLSAEPTSLESPRGHHILKQLHRVRSGWQQRYGVLAPDPPLGIAQRFEDTPFDGDPRDGRRPSPDPCRMESVTPCREWGPYGHAASDLPDLLSSDLVRMRHAERRSDGAREVQGMAADGASGSRARSAAPRPSAAPVSGVVRAVPARLPNPTRRRSVNSWPKGVRRVRCLQCGRGFESDSKAQRLCRACRDGAKSD